MDYVKLKDICEIGTGSSNAREAVEDGIYPFYIRSKEVKRINKYEYDEKAIIIPGEGGIGDIFHYVEGKYSLHQRAYRIAVKDEKIYPKFVYYYLKNFFKAWIISKAVSGTVISIRKPMIEEFKIPVINLDIQQKIANILDNYTKANDELIDNLNKEYSLRCKQYDYYKDKLLSFEDDVKCVKLCDLVAIKNGKDWKKLGAGVYPVYGSGGEMKVYVDKFSYDKPTVLIPRKGSIENIFYLEKPFWNVDTIFYTEINNEKIIPKFLYYFMKKYDLKKLSTNSTRPSLTQTVLNKIQIPLPPLEKQKEIVSILEKYESMYNEVRKKILAEIKLRERQYKYYMDKIFNFNKK